MEDTVQDEERPEKETQRKLLERIEALCDKNEDPLVVAKVWLMLEAPDLIDGALSELLPSSLGNALRGVVGRIPPIEEPMYRGVQPVQMDDYLKGRFDVWVRGTVDEGAGTVETIEGYLVRDLLNSDEGDLEDPPSLDKQTLKTILISALEGLNEGDVEA
jgi:hypothetical protein